MTTTVIFADDLTTNDLFSFSTTYATARSGGGTVNTNHTGSNFIAPGQYLAGATYYDIEGFARFNTSPIGTDIISAAVLAVWADKNFSDTDFTTNARIYDFGPTVTTADWVAGASLSALTLVAHFPSSAYVDDSYIDFTNDALAANINKTGYTSLIFCSDRLEAGTAPTNSEYVEWLSPHNTGTTNDPKITITHAAAGYAHSFASIIA